MPPYHALQQACLNQSRRAESCHSSVLDIIVVTIESASVGSPDPQKFPLTAALLEDRLKELEQAALVQFDDVRKTPPVQGGGFVWIVAMALVPSLLPHLSDNLGSADKNQRMGELLLVAWFLFLIYLALTTIPSILVFRSKRPVPYEEQLQDCIAPCFEDMHVTDEIMLHRLTDLILNQRYVEMNLLRQDSRNTGLAQAVLGWISMVLIFVLIVISGVFLIPWPQR